MNSGQEVRQMLHKLGYPALLETASGGNLSLIEAQFDNNSKILRRECMIVMSMMQKQGAKIWYLTRCIGIVPLFELVTHLLSAVPHWTIP